MIPPTRLLARPGLPSRRRWLAWTLALASGVGTAGARAADPVWPARPVRLVVPAPAGSSLDVLARLLADALKDRWTQPIVVDNKAGAGGMLGLGVVARAPADGHTLGIGFNGPIAFAPFLSTPMSYDPGKDLAPVVLLTSQPNVLAVPAALPVHDVAGFVAWAKAQAAGISYASVGKATSSHLTMELFKRRAGFDATHVPYGGSPPAAQATAAGETQAVFALAPALLPLQQAQRLRLLASTGAQRSTLLPDLPTLAESGYPGFSSLAWNGLFAPAGTPAPVLATLQADVQAALRYPALREALARQGLDGVGDGPEAFARFIEAERRQWRPVIEQAGVRGE